MLLGNVTGGLFNDKCSYIIFCVCFTIYYLNAIRAEILRMFELIIKKRSWLADQN